MYICRDWGRTLCRFWSRLIVGRRLAIGIWIGVGVVVTRCVSHLFPLLLLLLISLVAVAAWVLTLAVLIGKIGKILLSFLLSCYP